MSRTTLARESFTDFEARMDSLWWRMWNEDAALGKDPRFGRINGLVVLEQKVWRSNWLKSCIICGEPGTVERESILVKSVPLYFMCEEHNLATA